MSKVIDRFLKYVAYDTESDFSNKECPSTNKQFNLAKDLVEELKEIGLKDAYVDDKCYVYATLPANAEGDFPTIGFIAHMDTAPAYSGKDVKPQIIKNYDGKNIKLAKKSMISTKRFPKLKNYVGQDLIVTDGTTLLGADDKAGIAEIITAIEFLINNPEILHGDVKIAFTPDEEIGRGANLFDVEGFGADFAYTVDGGEIGELEYENFNAAYARINVRGISVHPGTAKGKLLNALTVALELNGLLPAFERPEYTEGYEGFYLLTQMSGDIVEANMEYIIRDHSREKFEHKKKLMLEAAKFLNTKYENEVIRVELEDSYYNMKEKIEPCMEIIELAKKSMIEIDIKPIIKPIRGGTDGARLSYKGLPCPNLFTGGHNFHGQYEYIPVQSMEKAVDLIVQIVKNSKDFK